MAKGITEQRRFGDGGSQQRLGLHCKMKWEDVRFTAGRRNGFGVQQVAWALLTACAALDVLAAQGQKTTPPGRRQVTRATSGAKA